jgi:hypothetical protein
MMAYAATVGRGRNRDALVSAGWGFMCQPDWVQSHGQPYALDNGAYAAFLRGERLNESAFYRAVDRFGEHADFVVLPDIVCGGPASLELSLSALEKLADLPAGKLIAVQNGFTWDDVKAFVSADVGIFVGGDTDWKINTLSYWGEHCAQAGVYMHVGRVNSVKRLRICAAAGAHSFDGSGVSRFSSELPRIDFHRRQADLFSPISQLSM